MLYHFGRFELDTDEFRLSAGGQIIPLEPKTLLLLGYLVGHPGKLVHKQKLLDAVWPDATVSENALTRAITLLRRALEDSSRDPQFIETVPKVGYRFIAEVKAEPSAMHTTTAVPQSVEAPQSESPAVAVGTTVPTPVAPPAGTDDRARGWWLRTAVSVSAAIVLSLGVWAFVSRPSIARLGHAMPSDNGPMAGVHAAKTGADQSAAREEIQRGLFFYDRRNGQASEAAFRRAIELDPLSASAHAGLAQALITQSLLTKAASPATIAQAEAEARKAVELDPRNAEAYIALGTVQNIFTWEWREAEQNLKRGLQLSPNNATGNMWYATYLDAMGRPEEAIERVRLAVDADPLSFFMLRQQASILYFGRHYDEALRVLERAREMSPSQTEILDNWQAWIDEQRGLRDEAVEHDLSANRQSLPAPQAALLRTVYRSEGWKAYWTARLEGMHPQTQTGCGLYTVGKAYVRVGKHDEAILSLRKAADQHCFWLTQMLVDPALDDLRHDTRFTELIARVGLPGQPSKSP